MKKILTSALALGAMTLIIGCGNDYVELSKEDLNNPLFQKGMELIKAQNGNDKLEFYDPRSLKSVDMVAYNDWLGVNFDPTRGSLDDKSYYKKLIFTINKSKDNKPDLYSLTCFKYQAENCNVKKHKYF
ncbi:hypothetical protein [Campylobacter jejuni]|uniref:hypothetical protein n=1 Tax=Campylobacter jejuni TaxID=197 RepID=UPI003A861A71